MDCYIIFRQLFVMMTLNLNLLELGAKQNQKHFSSTYYNTDTREWSSKLRL